METANRTVAKDTMGGCVISTVFIGLDHNFGEGLPLLFETMIFGEPDDFSSDFDGATLRYSSWVEAEEGHRIMIERLQAWTKQADKLVAEANALLEKYMVKK